MPPTSKIVRWAALAAAILLVGGPVKAISLDDIQLWTGAGTNRAALVIEWNSPIVFNNTTVPAPVANKTLVWGYRFNGAATGTQMFSAIVAANPRLYAVETNDPAAGTGIAALGFNLDGSGLAGLADGTVTNLANAFTNGLLTHPRLRADATWSLNRGDLFWSGDWQGPHWQIWHELGDQGGFAASPNRGANEFWDAATGDHGQWEFASQGLDDLPLTNGSWIGFSITPDGYPDNTNDPGYSTNLFIFDNDVQAPPTPDGTYTAYVCNPNDFAVGIVCTNDVYSVSPYDNPAAVLGRPTLKFIDHFMPHQTSIIHRSKIVEAPYWTDPNSNDVVTEINVGGQITVNMGRKIYDDPNNPYGVDLIIYGNSVFTAAGYGGAEITDFTDEGLVTMPGGSTEISGHPTIVSVSQDGTNWYTYPAVPALFPDNAYRWDDANHGWTDEPMNATKPLNPSISFADGAAVADALDQYNDSCGGMGYDLKASGFPWIQYVRIVAGTTLGDANPADYAVIDAIAAANPVVVGDALTITPDNLAAGITNLVFQNPANSSQNLITVNFDFVSDLARVSTVGLSEFSAFAPVIGNVSSAYQITLQPVTGTEAANYLADIGLRAGDHYTGNGGDLRVYQWNGAGWTSQPFDFNPTNSEVLVAGVTNFSALVVSQIIPPRLSVQTGANGFTFQFTPVANCAHILERSTDLVTWTPILTNPPASALPVTLRDPNPSAGKAFYRVFLKP